MAEIVGRAASDARRRRRRAWFAASLLALAALVAGVVVVVVSRSPGAIELVLRDRAGCASLDGTWSTADGSGPATCTIRTPAGGLTIGRRETVVVPRRTQLYVYGSVVNRGTLVIHACCSGAATGTSSFVIWGPSFRNEGTLRSDGDFGLFRDATFTNDGTLVNAGEPGIGSGGRIVNRSGGSIENRGRIEFHPPGGLTNSGRFANLRGAALVLTALGANGPGTAALRNSGELDNAGTISTESLVANSGVIRDACGARFADTARKRFSGRPVRNDCLKR